MSTRKALMFSFLERYSGLVIAIASSMAIARLLAPEDLGVFSVAMALLMLSATVRDMGAGQYVVQAKELTSDSLKAVWTIQLCVGFGLAFLIAILAWPAAAFYHEPRIASILFITAASYLFNPVGSITYALLMRDMAFGKLATMRLSASLVGALVSIGLAAHGHGPVSLAWGNFVSILTNALMAQFFRPGALPWGLNFQGTREVLNFGSRITGTALINTLMVSAPDFALGKLQGMVAAGLYSRSNGLVSMFSRLVTDAVYGVSLALFSSLRRENQDVRPGFFQAMSYIIVLNWAFSLGLMLLANPVTRLLYGHQWDDSVELTRWLALAGALAAPVPICIASCTGLGRADVVLKTSACSGLLSAAAALGGAYVSLRWMGIGIAIASGLGTWAWIRATQQVIDFEWGPMIKVLMHCGLVAVASALIPLIVMLHFGWAPSQPFLPLLLAAVGAALTLLLALVLSKHPLSQEVIRIFGRKPEAAAHSS